jgi:hypothetical protein
MGLGQLILDATLFAGTVALAATQRWDAKDLIWGLWISSLTLGYASIIMGVSWSIISDAWKPGPRGTPGRPVPAWSAAVATTLPNLIVFGAVSQGLPLSFRTVPVLILLVVGIVASLSSAFPLLPGGRPLLPPSGIAFRLLTRWPFIAFMVGFFTIHFVGFHFGHGTFLNLFFPIVPGASMGGGIDQMLGAFTGIVLTAASRYWPFVAISAVSFIPGWVGDLKGGRWTFFSPYRNVVKMHLLIFVFAGLFAAKLHDWAVYPVLVLYFFPWESLKALVWKKRQSRPWASPTGPTQPAEPLESPRLQQDQADEAVRNDKETGPK